MDSGLLNNLVQVAQVGPPGAPIWGEEAILALLAAVMGSLVFNRLHAISSLEAAMRRKISKRMGSASAFAILFV
jgi:hypothetical protein